MLKIYLYVFIHFTFVLTNYTEASECKAIFELNSGVESDFDLSRFFVTTNNFEAILSKPLSEDEELDHFGLLGTAISQSPGKFYRGMSLSSIELISIIREGMLKQNVRYMPDSSVNTTDDLGVAIGSSWSYINSNKNLAVLFEIDITGLSFNIRRLREYGPGSVALINEDIPPSSISRIWLYDPDIGEYMQLTF